MSDELLKFNKQERSREAILSVRVVSAHHHDKYIITKSIAFNIELPSRQTRRSSSDERKSKKVRSNRVFNLSWQVIGWLRYKIHLIYSAGFPLQLSSSVFSGTLGLRASQTNTIFLCPYTQARVCPYVSPADLLCHLPDRPIGRQQTSCNVPVKLPLSSTSFILLVTLYCRVKSLSPAAISVVRTHRISAGRRRTPE